MRGGDYEANQVPVKNGTCFTYFVCTYVCIPSKHETMFWYFKVLETQFRSEFRQNPAGMCNLGRLRKQKNIFFDVRCIVQRTYVGTTYMRRDKNKNYI